MDHPRNHWTKTTPWDWHSHVLSMFGETAANLLAMRVTSDEVSLNTCQFLTVLLSKARSGCWLVCHWSFGSSWRAFFFFGRAFLPSRMYILYDSYMILIYLVFFLFPLDLFVNTHGDLAPTHQVFRSWWSWVPCRCFSTAMVMTNGRWSWRRRLRPNWLPLATTFWRFVALGCLIFSAGVLLSWKLILIGFLRPYIRPLSCVFFDIFIHIV